VLLDVEDPTFYLDNRLTDGGEVVSPTRRLPFTPLPPGRSPRSKGIPNILAQWFSSVYAYRFCDSTSHYCTPFDATTRLDLSTASTSVSRQEILNNQ
jgi:hypothetical protein